MIPDRLEILKVVKFKTSRSGGAGGQNVNKVSSKVELILNIATAQFWSEETKQLLNQRLANRFDADGLLHVIAQEDRSQLVNKQKAVLKLMQILKNALAIDKKRVPTKIPKSAKLKRLATKGKLKEKKENRRRPNLH